MGLGFGGFWFWPSRCRRRMHHPDNGHIRGNRKIRSGVWRSWPFSWRLGGGHECAESPRLSLFLAFRKIKRANGPRDWVSGRRHLRYCPRFLSLTLCTRFQLCRQVQGWASLGHDPWGCGRVWYLSASNIPP